jgi:hypothetical protein
MAIARIAASASAALLLMLLATVAAQGNLFENALATALMPAGPAKIDASGIATPELAPVRTEKKTEGQLYANGVPTFRKLKPLPPEFIDTETLWLARCIFSETKRPHEQELVAWVVRNRVETAYRGKTSYQDVVLDPMQFSAFNPGNRKRTYCASLTPDAQVAGWQTALRIAHDVRWAEADQWRPFSTRTRHFYSEQSMVGQAHPEWASGFNPVSPERTYTIASHRFRFYEGVN